MLVDVLHSPTPSPPQPPSHLHIPSSPILSNPVEGIVFHHMCLITIRFCPSLWTEASGEGSVAKSVYFPMF